MSDDDTTRVEQIRAALPDGFESQPETLQALTVLRAMVAHGVLSAEQSDGLKSAMAEDGGCIAAYALRVAVETGDLDDFRRTVAVLLRSRSQRLNRVQRPRATDDSSVLLYFAPGMAEVAGRVALHAPGCVQLGHISWERFPDGFPNLFIQDAVRVRGRRCAFLADLHHPEAIFQQVRALPSVPAATWPTPAPRTPAQLAVIYALPRSLAASFQIILPYMVCETCCPPPLRPAPAPHQPLAAAHGNDGAGGEERPGRNGPHAGANAVGDAPPRLRAVPDLDPGHSRPAGGVLLQRRHPGRPQVLR